MEQLELQEEWGSSVQFFSLHQKLPHVFHGEDRCESVSPFHSPFISDNHLCSRSKVMSNSLGKFPVLLWEKYCDSTGWSSSVATGAAMRTDSAVTGWMRNGCHQRQQAVTRQQPEMPFLLCWWLADNGWMIWTQAVKRGANRQGTH